MICDPCKERTHRPCRIGCCCQHRGSGVPYLDDAARHALALGRLPARTEAEHPETIRINTNGDRP